MWHIDKKTYQQGGGIASNRLRIFQKVVDTRNKVLYNVAIAKETTNRKGLEMTGLQIMRTYKAERNQAEANIVFDHNIYSWRGQRIRVRMSFNGGVWSDVCGFDSYDEAEEYILTCDSLFHRIIDGEMLPRPEWADERVYIARAEMGETLREYGFVA